MTSTLSPNEDSGCLPSDLYVLGSKHAKVPHKTYITLWSALSGLSSTVNGFLKEFGISDTDGLQGLSLMDPSRPSFTHSVPLGEFLAIRRAVVKSLGGPRQLGLQNPFFNWTSVYGSGRQCHGFLNVPIDRLLFQPRDQMLLKKLLQNNVQDAPVLNFLSSDHADVIGLTEDERSRLREVAEMDAVKGNFTNVFRGSWDGDDHDLWILGFGEIRVVQLPPSRPLTEWCHEYQVDDEVLNWMIDFGLKETHDLRFLFVPRVPLGYFMTLRRAVNSWLPKGPIRLSHSCWTSWPRPLTFPDVPVMMIYQLDYEESSLSKLLDSRISSLSQLEYLSLDHLAALGWSMYNRMRLIGGIEQYLQLR